MIHEWYMYDTWMMPLGLSILNWHFLWPLHIEDEVWASLTCVTCVQLWCQVRLNPAHFKDLPNWTHDDGFKIWCMRTRFTASLKCFWLRKGKITKGTPCYYTWFPLSSRSSNFIVFWTDFGEKTVNCVVFYVMVTVNRPEKLRCNTAWGLLEGSGGKEDISLLSCKKGKIKRFHFNHVTWFTFVTYIVLGLIQAGRISFSRSWKKQQWSKLVSRQFFLLYLHRGCWFCGKNIVLRARLL